MNEKKSVVENNNNNTKVVQEEMKRQISEMEQRQASTLKSLMSEMRDQQAKRETELQ